MHNNLIFMSFLFHIHVESQPAEMLDTHAQQAQAKYELEHESGLGFLCSSEYV